MRAAGTLISSCAAMWVLAVLFFVIAKRVSNDIFKDDYLPGDRDG